MSIHEGGDFDRVEEGEIADLLPSGDMNRIPDADLEHLYYRMRSRFLETGRVDAIIKVFVGSNKIDHVEVDGKSLSSSLVDDLYSLNVSDYPGLGTRVVHVVEQYAGLVARAHSLGEALVDAALQRTGDSPSFSLYLDPGSATAEDIANVFSALSDLYRAHGGKGLEIVPGSTEVFELRGA
ncbi:MAG: hypothetical protein AAF170_04240 [Bacteroidota bacterium]